MLIFGSTAAKYWFPDFPREPKDLDFISRDGKNSREIEYHWAEGFQFILDNNKDSKYVDPDFLYTIKVSHAAWDVRWDKTIYDIKFFKDKGCKLNRDLYYLLLKDWETIHVPKKIRVKGAIDEFFKPNITRRMNHEQLHELVKFYKRPLHESIRPDLNDVRVSEELWNKLSYDDKLKCSLEEAYVFALERYETLPPKIALTKGIKHLITKSTKGFFNLFLIENFFELLYYNREHYLKIYEQYQIEVLNE